MDNRIRAVCGKQMSAFETVVRGTKKLLRIATPFISREEAQHLLSVLTPEVELELVTCATGRNVSCGACDAEALAVIGRAGAQDELEPIYRIWTHADLHAKLYVADTHAALITSGNLTHHGMYLQWEYGLLVEEPALVREVVNDFERLRNGSVRLRLSHLEWLVEIARDVPPPDGQNMTDRAIEGSDANLESQVRELLEDAIEVDKPTVVSLDSFVGNLRIGQEQAHTLHGILSELRSSGETEQGESVRAILQLLDVHGPLTAAEQRRLLPSLLPHRCDDSVYYTSPAGARKRYWIKVACNAREALGGSKRTRKIIQLVNGRWELIR